MQNRRERAPLLLLGKCGGFASGGGLQKWTLDGAVWTLAATFQQGITSGLRGLAAIDNGATVTLVATSVGTGSNALVVFVDDGASLNPAAVTIATAPTNTAFRGVALAPSN